MAFVIDRSLYLSPEVGEPGPKGPLKEVDPFSLEALVAWLEKQDADERYNYNCNGHCLLAQYFPAVGVDAVAIYSNPSYRDSAGEYHSYPRQFDHIACYGERTFGAALSRAKALLAEREK